MMNTRFDIATFIKAYAGSEELGSRYFEYVAKWQNAYNIVEAYRLSDGDVNYFNDALARSIIEYGIEHFQYQEEKYAKKAYYTLLNLDAEYSLKYGTHFKNYAKCSTHQEMVEYLIAFDDAYNDYMAGGHVDYEDR